MHYFMNQYLIYCYDETKIILLKFLCPEHRGVIKCADSKIICFIIISHFDTAIHVMPVMRSIPSLKNSNVN